MATLEIEEFLGINTGVAKPPFNSASSCVNLIRYRHRGEIEHADGYTSKYKFPQTTEKLNPQYLDPVVYGVNNLVWKDIHNFFVPDHGGKYITIGVATYQKTGFFPIDPDFSGIDRFGIFARPYWDGSAWIDEWRELTEMFIFSIADIPISPISYSAISIVNDVSYGNSSWSNPSNALSDDGLYATSVLQVFSPISNYLKADFGVIGTSNAEIEGIEVYVKRLRTAGAGNEINDSIVRLVKNGVIVGDNKSDVATWSSFETTKVYGGQYDLWGTTWNPSDTIGFVFSAGLVGSLAPTASVNKIYIKIYTHNGYRIIIDDGTYGFATLDPTAKVFNSTYFKGWTIVYDPKSDNENFDLVSGCGYDSGKYFLKLFHLNNDYLSRIVGTRLLVYRNFTYKELPSTISSWIYNLLSEIRMTTGNNTTDVSLLSQFRTQDFSITDAITGRSYPHNVDALTVDTAVMDFWKYAGLMMITGSTADVDGIAAGTYYLKYAIRLDDGNYTKLFDALTLSGLTATVGKSIVLAAPSKINLTLARSLGAFSKRMKSIAICISADDIVYTIVDEINLNTLLSVKMLTVDSNKHLFATNDMTITSADILDDDPISAAQIDRSSSDDGVIQYKYGIVSNKRTFAVGVRRGDKLYPNQIAVSAFNGDGQSEYDVFPDDNNLPSGSPNAHILDVEYNDGDQALAVGIINDRILTLKQRGAVLLTPDQRGGYEREQISKSVGICSPRSLLSWEDMLLWHDYSGLMGFTTGKGIFLMNPEFLNDWKNFSNAEKEASYGIIDTFNRLWRVSIADKEYVFELDGDIQIGEGVIRHGNQWTETDLYDQPSIYSFDSNDRTIDFFSQSDILKIKNDGTVRLHNGQPVTFSRESNRIEPPKVGHNYRILLRGITFYYESTVDVTVRLYLDDSPTPFGQPWIMKKENKWETVKAPLFAKCNGFRFGFSGIIASEIDSFDMRSAVISFQELPAGADISEKSI